jgi:two-component system, OmpR family, response regulator
MHETPLSTTSDKVAKMSPVRDEPRQLKCVLCIDDEPDFQSIIKISLERLGGIKTHFCTDPQQGMARAREVRPDLILLDLLMPGLDGATLFEHFQADRDLALIPVVFLTAVMTGPEARKVNSLGAAGVLIKPFDVLELPRKLSAIWSASNIAGPAELP